MNTRSTLLISTLLMIAGALLSCTGTRPYVKDRFENTFEDPVIILDEVIKIPSTGVNRKEIHLVLPVITGLKNATVFERLQETLSLKALFGVSLDDIRKEAAEGDLGTQRVHYQVNFNRHDILDITLTMETMGAYPDHQNAHRIFDLKTGARLSAADTFNKAMLNSLLARVKEMKAAHEKDAVNGLDVETKNVFVNLVSQAELNLISLDEFSVSEKGVTFLYNYDFPHVMRALEPNGQYFMSYAELKPYIDPKGPLGVFLPH
jgi:hypothetical protein